MKIIVINLAAEAARWAAVQAEFASAGLRPGRLVAVAGTALSPARRARHYDERLNRMQYHRPLRPGEIGCYASHIAAWQQLLRGDDASVAIFEDDVDIATALPRVLEAIARSPLDWDLVKLIGRPVEKVHARTPLCPGHALIQYRRVPSLTGAYAVTRRGAEKLLAGRRRFGRPVDVDLRHWWECDLRIYGVQPYPVRAAATSAASTIDGRDVPASPAMRLHKLRLQARYSWLNWRELRSRSRAAAVAAVVAAAEPATRIAGAVVAERKAA